MAVMQAIIGNLGYMSNIGYMGNIGNIRESQRMEVFDLL